MVEWDKHVKLWRLIATILAVPAGLAGTYGVYRNYVSEGVSCPQVKTLIVSILEKNIPPAAKRKLFEQPIRQFDAHCGDTDPEARLVFDAALNASYAAPAKPKATHKDQPADQRADQPADQPASPPPAPSSQPPAPELKQAQAEPPAPSDAHTATLAAAAFGVSKTGAKRGWVTLVARDANRNEQPNFDADGNAVSSKTPPKAGVLLMARRGVAVWFAPGATNDQASRQGRVTPGACVKILSIRPTTPRLWAEVIPQTCQ